MTFWDHQLQIELGQLLLLKLIHDELYHGDTTVISSKGPAAAPVLNHPAAEPATRRPMHKDEDREWIEAQAATYGVDPERLAEELAGYDVWDETVLTWALARIQEGRP